MRVLVAFEYSGRVRDAFIAMGHLAMSCDLRDSETPGPHYKGDIRDVLTRQHGSGNTFDLMIAHPYCTFNCNSGIRWMYHPDDTHLPPSERRRHPNYPNRMDDFMKGVDLFNFIKNSDIQKIGIENSIPHGLAMQHIGRYDQIVQPWMFGEPQTKACALWLKGLPKLVPTHKKSDHPKIFADCHNMSPGPSREKERSRTRQCIANAMAAQWGKLELEMEA